MDDLTRSVRDMAELLDEKLHESKEWRESAERARAELAREKEKCDALRIKVARLESIVRDVKRHVDGETQGPLAFIAERIAGLEASALADETCLAGNLLPGE